MVFRAFAVVLLLLAGTLGSLAQSRQPVLSPQARLDKLFEQLKAAKDEPEARSISAEIERQWSRSGSDTCDLLLKRAVAAVASGHQDVAFDLLDSVLALKPGWTEARNRRATLSFLRNDLDAAMRDLAVVLEQEPRQFVAWAGLGMVLLRVDDKKRALEAFDRALAINPQLDSVKERVRKLHKELDGTPI